VLRPASLDKNANAYSTLYAATNLGHIRFDAKDSLSLSILGNDYCLGDSFGSIYVSHDEKPIVSVGW
jgi:hypothetical protein